MKRQNALFFLFMFAFCLSAAAPEQWTWTSRRSGPERLNAVAASNEMFVAVGDGGAILSSPDGIEWTPRNSGTLHGLYSVIWGDGMFVAGGDSGTIVTSEDGVEWTVRHSGWGRQASGLLWDGGKYLAYTYNLIYMDEHIVLISNDGIEWIKQLVNYDGQYFGNVVYSDGLFMAAYDDCEVFTSTDGVNWQGCEQEWEQGCELSGITFLALSYRACVRCSRPGDPICMPACLSDFSIASGNGIVLLLGLMGLARYEKEGGWEILDVYCPEERGVMGGYRMFYDGTHFIMFGYDGIYFTEKGDVFEQMSTKAMIPTAMAYNGNVYVTVGRTGTEIGTLSKDITAIINSKQAIKPTSTFIVRQSGRTLRIRIPNQDIRPQIILFNIAGKRHCFLCCLVLRFLKFTGRVAPAVLPTNLVKGMLSDLISVNIEDEGKPFAGQRPAMRI